MKFNTFTTSLEDIKQCTQIDNLDEVLLEPKLLARQGRLSATEICTLALVAHQHQLRPVLVWDALMPQQLMIETCAELAHWDLSLYAAVRVCDVGVAHWLCTHQPQLPIQLVVETGNHNLNALQGWCDFFAPNLERLILSLELPEEKLIAYCQSLPVACEVLGVGQILLFYSPRSLLASHFNVEADTALYLDAIIASEQVSLRSFPTLETRHGTFMFLDKDQFILDRSSALAQAGLHTMRLDLRHLSQTGHAASDIVTVYHSMLTAATTLRKGWPRPTRAPFFKANKTTAQFSRMKSKLDQYRDQTSLAEVIGGEKNKYLVFHALRAFDVTIAQEFVLPSDEVLPLPTEISFRDLNGDPLTMVETGQIFTSEWLKKGSAKALLRA